MSVSSRRRPPQPSADHARLHQHPGTAHSPLAPSTDAIAKMQTLSLAPVPLDNALLSHSAPHTTWESYQYSLFGPSPSRLNDIDHHATADAFDFDDEDAAMRARMVDWVVGGNSQDDSTAAAAAATGLAPVGDDDDFDLLLRETRPTSSHTDARNSRANGYSSAVPGHLDELLTFEISDLNVSGDPSTLAHSAKSSPAKHLAQPPTLENRLSLSVVPHSTSSSAASISGINHFASSSGGRSPHSQYSAALNQFPNTSSSPSAKASLSLQPPSSFAIPAASNAQSPGSGTSPVLINSFVGSGNAMRPNGLFSSTPNAAPSFVTASSFGGGGTSAATHHSKNHLSSSFQDSGFVGPSLRSIGSLGRIDTGISLLSGTASQVASSVGGAGLNGITSSGLLLPPGRVVGGLVLNHSDVARSELSPDGCPILKLPRMPFLGIPGTMDIPHRVWKKGGTEKPDNRHFMIMSYNVLAPMYCTDSRYRDSKAEILEWDHRRKKILDEISFYSPDFICLQELPPSDFKEFFLPSLQKIGYDGHFQQKKREHAADGCATFFLEARFSLMAVQAFAYNDQLGQDPTPDLQQRLAPFPNIALVCVFQNRQARSLRCRIVNTHMHWDPARADTKLLQAAILMEWLERAPHRDVPTAIAADLNSRPGEAVVDYLVRGKVAPGALFAGKDFGRFTNALTVRNPATGVTVLASQLARQPGFEGLLNGGVVIPNPHAAAAAAAAAASSMSSTANGKGSPAPPPPPQMQTLLPLLRHGTKLASAYDRKDLPFTNKTPDFEGSIDHILYTSGTLSIRDVLGDFDHTYYPEPPPQQTDAAGAAAADDDEKDLNGTADDSAHERAEHQQPQRGATQQAGAWTSPSLAPAAAASDSSGVTQGLPPRTYHHHHQPPPPTGYLAT
ncbi:Glucose-repressible alcohol dehydrogenase transcriptional effector, partial [Entophlyctis luteolus]